MIKILWLRLRVGAEGVRTLRMGLSTNCLGEGVGFGHNAVLVKHDRLIYSMSEETLGRW